MLENFKIRDELIYLSSSGTHRIEATHKIAKMAGQESDYDDFSSDGEENSNPLLISSKKKTVIKEGIADESDNESPENDNNAQEGQDDETEGGENQSDEKDEAEVDAEEKKKAVARINKKLQANKKLKHKTGVVYFSSIPPYMKPAKMRQILSRFGDVDRLFLKREDEQKHKRRTRGGGNKKVMYEEGWAEFIRKRDAKLCADTLNGNIIGGKKGSFYHDDILNVKYLPGFKWTDLTEQIARENDIRQSKLEIEISQANKMNAEFAKNVEKSKMLENIKRSKRSASEDSKRDANSHRSFKQHKVATTRADAPSEIKQKNSSKDLGSVLNSLF